MMQSLLIINLFFYRENVRKWYNDLSEINKDLIMSYNIRYNNHKEIMNVLKEINVIIQRCARLRGNI